MKGFLIKWGMALFMGLIIPVLLLSAVENCMTKKQTKAVEKHTWKQPVYAQQIPVELDGEVITMDLEEYILGVVLGEMPMSFEDEALKAQGVVARTYTMRAYYNGSKHAEAAVCGESSCCQAYLSPKEYLEKGGTQEKLKRLKSLLKETVGQVITYEGELILAAYFSCSGGSTEDAAAVWGEELPYLQATQSPGEETANTFYDSLTFTGEQLQDKLGVTLNGSADTWIGSITYTDGGGVDTIQIGGKTFSGTDIRKKLGLRSTMFSFIPQGDKMTVETKGFGHRVGMSQYGADAMAKLGSTYPQIVAHYYAGTELTVLSGTLTKKAR